MAASVVLALPTLLDTRLAILVPVIGVTVVVACNSKRAVWCMALSFLFALLLSLQPHGADLLLLELKYSDNFTYITDDRYYADILGSAVKYSRTYGTNYYSVLYEDTIVENIQTKFPIGTVFGDISVAEVQTDAIFFGWQSFYNTARPTVVVHAKLPEEYERWGEHNLPDNVKLEVIP